MLDLEFLTDEQDVIILCQKYWHLDSDGKFNVSLRELAPFHGITNYGYVELIVLHKSIARDTRRRCPVCGIPQRVGSRQSALLPVTPQPPCSDCRYLKLRGTARTDDSARVTSIREPESGMPSKSAVSALVLLTCLRHLIGIRLYEGFSINDCERFVPAHTVRFINMLHKDGFLKKASGSKQAKGSDSIKYFLTDDLKLREDLKDFNNQGHFGKAFDFSGLKDLWLDYAVAMCVRFLCGQCVLYGLPIAPENKELCAVLRTVLSARSIVEALSMSARAVQLIIEIPDNDPMAGSFTEAIFHNIEQEYKLVLEEESAQHLIVKPAALSCSEVGDWFKKWYEIDELTPGHAITHSMFARIRTNR